MLCNIDENLVTKGLKKFVEIEKRKKLNISNKQTKPSEFITIYCNKLNLSTDVKRLCIILCDRSTKLGILKNNTPPSVASDNPTSISTEMARLAARFLPMRCRLDQR